MTTDPVSHAEIRRLFAAIDDHRVLEILALQPSLDELQVTEAYLAGMTDVMGEEHLPLAGKPASIYEIVTRDDDFLEDEFRQA